MVNLLFLFPENRLTLERKAINMFIIQTSTNFGRFQDNYNVAF